MKKLVVLGVLFASVSAPAMAAQHSCSRNLSQLWFKQSCATIAVSESFRNDGGSRSGARSHSGAEAGARAGSPASAGASASSGSAATASGAQATRGSAASASAASNASGNASAPTNASSTSQPASSEPGATDPGIDPTTTGSISAKVGGTEKGKHANNGFGNGDQDAPGGSLAHNNAENATGTKGHGGRGQR